MSDRTRTYQSASHQNYHDSSTPTENLSSQDYRIDKTQDYRIDKSQSDHGQGSPERQRYQINDAKNTEPVIRSYESSKPTQNQLQKDLSPALHPPDLRQPNKQDNEPIQQQRRGQGKQTKTIHQGSEQGRSASVRQQQQRQQQQQRPGERNGNGQRQMEWNDYRNQPRYNSTKSYLSSTAKGDRRNNSTQQDQNTFRNGDDQLVVAPSKATTSNTKGDDLCKSMEALSTKDESSTIDDNTSILECMGKSIKMVTLQDMFEKYEYMRGGCNLQLIDETKALVVFGHPSTAKRAWEENKDNGVISIQGYQGPMDIVKDPTPVRKSMINQRTRPSNPAAQRFIHGALGLKSPARKIERQ